MYVDRALVQQLIFFPAKVLLEALIDVYKMTITGARDRGGQRAGLECEMQALAQCIVGRLCLKQ